MSNGYMAEDHGYKGLANAIVLCAVRDWCFATLAMRDVNKYTVTDVKKRDDAEGFLRSNWCESISGVNGSYILAKLKHEDIREIVNRLRLRFVLSEDDNGKRE